MVDEEWLSGLDADAACAALAAAHSDLLEVECRRLLVAAHWIDLHAPADEPDTDEPDTDEPDAGRQGGRGRVLPGMERTVACGADGTPLISEFACAEFAALQGMHPAAGRVLLAKVANLRHRHPRLWARVRAGEVRGWQALEVARLVGRPDYALSLAQARDIDTQTAEWITTLPWGALEPAGGPHHRRRPGRGRGPPDRRRGRAVRGHRPVHRAGPEDVHRQGPGRRRDPTGRRL